MRDIAPLCKSGAHCRTCRDAGERGRRWRAEFAGMDWECPQGKPWGYEPPSRGLGDTVERLIKKVTFGKVKPCGGCKKRRDTLNRLVPYR